jgi:anti-sigma regulatory factor (Ser/Thr protein kinase)
MNDLSLAADDGDPHPGRPEPMARAFEARIPGTPLGVQILRREMAELAKDCGMDAEGIADVRLAVTEAATNAVIHAYAEVEGELRVRAAVDQGELAIVIGDTGPGLVERRDSPGLGLGLSLIATVAERLRIVNDSRGTEIHMAFPCPNADEA